MTSNEYRNPASVSIGGTDVRVVTYKGEPVVTFAMVDEIHKRPEGTAKRTFAENRERFMDGEDFTLVPASQRDEFRTFGIEVPNRGLTLLTRRGYLKLVKPLTDDRAWEVQGEMIDRYFMVEKIAAMAPDLEKMLVRDDGMLKSLVRDLTALSKAVPAMIEDAAQRLVSQRVQPTFDLAGTVNADDIIERAGIKPGDRVRGTANMVTRAMLEFTSGIGCFKTPKEWNRSRPWRFPREKAEEWLFGSGYGAERIRNQISEQKRKKDKKGQRSLRLVPFPGGEGA